QFLRSATTAPARFFGLDSVAGQVAPGYQADLAPAGQRPANLASGLDAALLRLGLRVCEGGTGGVKMASTSSEIDQIPGAQANDTGNKLGAYRSVRGRIQVLDTSARVGNERIEPR